MIMSEPRFRKNHLISTPTVDRPLEYAPPTSLKYEISVPCTNLMIYGIRKRWHAILSKPL